MHNDHSHPYYRILGLDPDASPEEIKQAYRRLAKAWHPDRFTHDPHLQQQALEKFQEINQAYATLQAVLRQARSRSQDAPPRAPSPPPRSAASRRRSVVVWPWSVPTWLVALVAFVVLRLIADAIVLTPPSRFGELDIALRYSLPVQTPIVPRSSQPQSIPVAHPARPDGGTSPDVSRPSRFFTIGSSKDEVLAIQGRPTVASHRVWEYGGSRVYFHQGRVTRWEIWPRDPLKARLRPTVAVEVSQAYFTVGSTKDEVLAVQGSPTRFAERIWEYDYSRIYFDGNRVTHWDEWPSSPLKARR